MGGHRDAALDSVPEAAVLAVVASRAFREMRVDSESYMDHMYGGWDTVEAGEVRDNIMKDIAAAIPYLWNYWRRHGGRKQGGAVVAPAAPPRNASVSPSGGERQP